jgi:hypothetical protein
MIFATKEGLCNISPNAFVLNNKKILKYWISLCHEVDLLNLMSMYSLFNSDKACWNSTRNHFLHIFILYPSCLLMEILYQKYELLNSVWFDCLNVWFLIHLMTELRDLSNDVVVSCFMLFSEHSYIEIKENHDKPQ